MKSVMHSCADYNFAVLARCLLTALFAVLQLGCGSGWAATGANPPNSAKYGVDLNGHAVTSLASPDSRAVVLIFVASDCPICNRYVPAMRDLEKEFAAQHVRFWVVYPNPGETAEGIRSQQQAFGQSVSTLLDPGQTLVKMAGVQITPEAAVFVPEAAGLREVYRGRIDNRYISLGQQRPRATGHDLEVVIAALLAGTPVPKPTGRAVGCSIVPLP
jgi:thiol-disulfide isomerase/thioredoxin